MIGKLPKDDHRELFRTRLADLINPQHELALLAHAIEAQAVPRKSRYRADNQPLKV
jgi:hypothetical protein